MQFTDTGKRTRDEEVGFAQSCSKRSRVRSFSFSVDAPWSDGLTLRGPLFYWQVEQQQQLTLDTSFANGAYAVDSTMTEDLAMDMDMGADASFLEGGSSAACQPTEMAQQCRHLRSRSHSEQPGLSAVNMPTGSVQSHSSTQSSPFPSTPLDAEPYFADQYMDMTSSGPANSSSSEAKNQLTMYPSEHGQQAFQQQQQEYYGHDEAAAFAAYVRSHGAPGPSEGHIAVSSPTSGASFGQSEPRSLYAPSLAATTRAYQSAATANAGNSCSMFEDRPRVDAGWHLV